VNGGTLRNAHARRAREDACDLARVTGEMTRVHVHRARLA
jgi:hypothetical protein